MKFPIILCVLALVFVAVTESKRARHRASTTPAPRPKLELKECQDLAEKARKIGQTCRDYMCVEHPDGPTVDGIDCFRDKNAGKTADDKSKTDSSTTTRRPKH